jgi:hypothetical protein
MLLGAIEFDLLLNVIWESLVAGIGVTLVFSLVIFGSAQAAEARREGRGGAAMAFGLLAAVAMAIVAAGVVLAITVILHKS